MLSSSVTAQQPPAPAGPVPSRIEITPARVEAEVGESVKFTAVGYDSDGPRMDLQPTAWFGSPFDTAAADEGGTATFFLPGEARIGAIIGGKPGFATVTIRPQRVARIEIVDVSAPIAVGAGVKLAAVAKTSNGDPRNDVDFEWTSNAPRIAAIDPAGLVTGVAPGRARLSARSGSASATVDVIVVANPVKALSVTPRTTRARTGDVVRFAATATGTSAPAIRWSVSGVGATIEPDGAFVAERPGSYIVTASSGDKNAVGSIVVSPRNVTRALELVGRTPLEEFQTAEQWIIGNYLYVGSMSGRIWVYDISNPAAPVKTDSVAFDARLINDVSTTADGKTMVVTREGASSRKNGIVFLDVAEPAHPKVISEYTATVTGGVHSAFVDGHHVYLTDDATGSLRVVDFSDVKNPKEVARWEVDKEVTRPVKDRDGNESIAGRYLHDIVAKDGLLYLGYWRDGLIILDIGAGLKGGSPAAPKLVSQLRFNYLDLYGPGWVAGAHSVFRYKNYVFLGDEVFPAQFNIQSRDRIPVQGIVHVVDVSDIERPRKVAEYAVPEAGAHNMWVTDDDVMVMGYYNGGGRVVDVSGELRGNLYQQGREIARLWTGDPKGWRPNLPFTWGAQPHRGLIYFNDINSGIWITRLPPAAKP
jgi:plastocyanin